MSVEAQSPEHESSNLKVDTVETTGMASSSPSKASVAAPEASGGKGNPGSTNANTNAASQNLAAEIKDTFKSFGSKKTTKPLIIHRDAHSIVLAGH